MRNRNHFEVVPMRFNTSRSKDISIDLDQENKTNPAPRASRREVLQWIAMAGAGSLLPASSLLAQASAPTGRIDVHTHTVPPFYTKVMEKEILATGHPLPTWTPALHIETGMRDISRNAASMVMCICMPYVSRVPYRESSQIQFTSQVFPPSGEKDCSIRAEFGEILSQT